MINPYNLAMEVLSLLRNLYDLPLCSQYTPQHPANSCLMFHIIVIQCEGSLL